MCGRVCLQCSAQRACGWPTCGASEEQLGVTLCPQVRRTALAKRGVLRLRDLASYLVGELCNPLVFPAPQVPLQTGVTEAGASRGCAEHRQSSKGTYATHRRGGAKAIPLHSTKNRAEWREHGEGAVS